MSRPYIHRNSGKEADIITYVSHGSKCGLEGVHIILRKSLHSLKVTRTESNYLWTEFY